MSGKVSVTDVEPGGSEYIIQEVVREAEDKSSPLSTSPSAKMIKIEEMAEVPSHSSEQLVAPPFLFHVALLSRMLHRLFPPNKHVSCFCFPEFL